MNTMLTRLRDAALDTADEVLRINLNLKAAELEDALLRLTCTPTEAILREVTGHWRHGLRLIEFAAWKARKPLKTFEPVPSLTEVASTAL